MTQLQAGLMRVPLPRETPDAKLAKQVSAASERYPSLRSASIWLCCSLALRIAPRAQCGVINAAAAALCSRTAFLPFLHVPFSLPSARSLIGDACILKIFIDFCGLSLSCFFAVCRCFYFVSLVICFCSFCVFGMHSI